MRKRLFFKSWIGPICKLFEYVEDCMKYARALTVITLGLMLIGCGGSSNVTPGNPASGAWSETLASPAGQQLGSFTFDITQNNTALTGSTMNFSNMGPLAQCFGAGTVMTGQMGQGMMNGGSMTMSMSWTAPNSTVTNILTMQGNMSMGMGSGSGTFTMTGQTPGCPSETGTFTMSHSSSAT